MINAKVKIFNEDHTHILENVVNDFLQKIDIRQIIKTEYSTGVSSGPHRSIVSYSAIIYYVDLADVRDAKIDNFLEIK
jgi:hypothetical protein